MFSHDDKSRNLRWRAAGPRHGAAAGPRARRRRAFTLVELLVVIGIIAILVSIMIPTAGLIRRWADSAKCLSNLKQVGVAIASYSNDHDGYLVPGDYFGLVDGSNQPSPGNWVIILVDEKYITATAHDYSPGAKYAADITDRDSILSCPNGQDTDMVDSGLPTTQTDGRGTFFSARGSDIDHTAVKNWYAVNCFMRANGAGLSAQDLRPRPFTFLPDYGNGTANWQLKKVSQLARSDTRLPLVFDGVWVFFPNFVCINARHGDHKYTNILFADFHCESQLSASLPNDDWYVQ